MNFSEMVNILTVEGTFDLKISSDGPGCGWDIEIGYDNIILVEAHSNNLDNTSNLASILLDKILSED